MSDIPRNPRADRTVNHLLAGISFETKEERQRVAAASMEPLVGVQKAINEYQRQLVDGLESRDPTTILASVQKLQDVLVDFLTMGDPQAAKMLDQRERTIVTRAANIMTQNGYRRETSTGSYVADSYVARSLRETLRDNYRACEASREAETEAAPKVPTP